MRIGRHSCRHHHRRRDTSGTGESYSRIFCRRQQKQKLLGPGLQPHRWPLLHFRHRRGHRARGVGTLRHRCGRLADTTLQYRHFRQNQHQRICHHRRGRHPHIARRHLSSDLSHRIFRRPERLLGHRLRDGQQRRRQVEHETHRHQSRRRDAVSRRLKTLYRPDGGCRLYPRFRDRAARPSRRHALNLLELRGRRQTDLRHSRRAHQSPPRHLCLGHTVFPTQVSGQPLRLQLDRSAV